MVSEHLLILSSRAEEIEHPLSLLHHRVSRVCREKMDGISGLSDDLLVKILCFLPTKAAASTCVLSKRWESLWAWLPKLDYFCRSKSEYESFRRFLNGTLPVHRASVLESFRLGFGCSSCKPEDVKLWILIAVSRNLRELDISFSPFQEQMEDIFPRRFYACKSLVVLKLGGGVTLDVPRMVSLPSLKTLQLKEVIGIDGESLQKLLSVCPVLENLLVEFDESENLRKIIVIGPSLQSLSLSLHWDCYLEGLGIYAPSLKYLKLVGFCPENGSYLVEKMPKLEEAYLDVNFLRVESFIGSITSVKRLTLCSLDMYGEGFVFDQLEHLKLCDCRPCSSYILPRLIKDSPNLRALDIFQMEDHYDGSGMVPWHQPSTVPKCLQSSLQTFSWTAYLGIPAERDVALYILQNAGRLRTAEISSVDDEISKLEILKDLSLSSRASTTCQLSSNKEERSNMRELEEAYVNVRYRDISSLIGESSPNLLARMLQYSPNLRVLDIFEMDHYGDHWLDPPSTVDESVTSSLQAFDWSGYVGRRPQEKDLKVYILGNRWSLQDCNKVV